ncbi:MAG: cell division protein FtsH, partial [Planctomycetota bacterium]
FGRQRKSRHIEEEERVATAYHEAGHAVLQVLLPDTDPLHKVTIIPRGEYGGASMSLPEKDRYGYGLRWLKATMRVLCGGRIAELKKTGDVSSGAAADIQQVTRMARTMVLEWGMSERLGFLRFGPEPDREGLFAEREYSEETARIIDEEIKRFADEAYSDARRLIEEHWDKVVRVAEALLQHETLTAEEVQRLLEGRTLSKPSVADLLAREAAARKAASASPSAAATPSEDEDPGPIAAPQPA